MSAPLWMAYYPRDYLAKTAHLSTLQHGAYRLLIDICWINGGTLPDDDAQLARIAGLTIAEWRKMRSVIAAFFKINDGVWRHNRIDSELEKSQKNIADRQKGAKKANAVRWKKTKKPIIAERSLSDALGDPQLQSQLQKKEGVPEKVDAERGKGSSKSPDTDSDPHPRGTVIKFPPRDDDEGEATG